MQRSIAQRLVAVSIILAVAVPLSGCGLGSARETVTIGYMGGLSGRSASLGLRGREGAQLAIELANASNSEEVEFVLKEADDAVDSAAAIQALAESDAVAIVGPMTSGSALVATPIANGLGITLISPAVSTDLLSGLDDQFLRVYPSNKSAAQELARQVTDQFGETRISAIYDHGNRAHTETWLNHFKKYIDEQGGVVSTEATFTSGQNPDYSALASSAVNGDATCVFILANAIDTAMLAQRIRAAGSDAHILATEWSSTEDVVEHGGRAVDGMGFIQTFDRTSTNPDYIDFVSAYKERFGYEPGFAALHAFDATRMVIDAVSRGASRETMKQTILDGGPYRGVQSEIVFDQYGDVTPDYFLMTIQEGRFVRAAHQ